MNPLRDALRNATATLETLMAHYGHAMPHGDRTQRERVLRDAHDALDADHDITLAPGEQFDPENLFPGERANEVRNG